MQRHEPAPIAVAQRKGMWMGGNVPLGYNVKDSQFTFSKWIMKKGAVMPLHHHANEQITWITQGETEVYSQGKKYVMHAGDIMIIPPNVPHAAAIRRRARSCSTAYASYARAAAIS